eukprot:CAMPEP_0119053116 /NCGR_PEP_ID=MMETSP1177-20130426/74207_1 /TAXON_ID=2985 /ORGANISM="Ochromonas sp, Strain CCMP1899" /LENGTH=113 /DNA_ID=CAMNT_0007032947 /DNA_START=615 /DNA_END=956 /DNA_ORIENTATION=+
MLGATDPGILVFGYPDTGSLLGEDPGIVVLRYPDTGSLLGESERVLGGVLEGGVGVRVLEGILEGGVGVRGGIGGVGLRVAVVVMFRRELREVPATGGVGGVMEEGEGGVMEG